MMRSKILFVVFLILWFSLILNSQEHKVWPTQGWEKSSPEAQGLSEETLSELDKKISSGDY